MIKSWITEVKLWLKNLARLFLPVYQFESGTIKIAYAGYSSIKKSYYVRLLLGKDHHHTFIGMRWFWQMPYLISSRNLDFVIVEIGQYAMRHFQNCDGYILPEWALMKIDIDRPLCEIIKRSVSDFSDVLRLIRKYNLTYEILDSQESFKYFNDNLYLPYITKRYGEEALIEDLKNYIKTDPPPFLMVIRENGIIVAGSLIKNSDDVIFLLRLGLLDGNEEYRRHGVIGALYYFSILEGQKRGCRQLDIGGTRPFLTNGLTKYKIGLTAEFNTNNYVLKSSHWLGINRNSDWAKDFICKNPFMHLNKDLALVRSDKN